VPAEKSGARSGGPWIGAGAGVSLVGLAHQLPAHDHILASLVTYAAPVASLWIRAVWQFAATEVTKSWNRRQRQAELRRLLENQKLARLQRQQTHDDPHATPAQKTKAAQTCAAIDELIQDMLRKLE